VTADQRRQAVRQLQETFGVSQRRACRVLGQPRATQRQQPKKTKQGEERLVRRMLELVGQHPRWGYRRIGVLLRREGWRVNRKRVYRLWRQQGLEVPRKQRKKRRLGSSVNGCVRRRAEHRNDVWAWDFIHDRTSDGRPLKGLTLVDEYTRECLVLEVRRGMTAKAVSEVLAGVVRERGAPAHLRSDNGPEFIAQVLRAWVAQAGIETLYIEPGTPWENGYALGERVRGVVQQQGARGAVERGGVCQPAGGRGAGQGLEAGVQRGPASGFVGVSDASGVRGVVSSSRLRCATPSRGHDGNEGNG